MFHFASPCLTNDRFSLWFISGWFEGGGSVREDLFDRIVKWQNEQMSPDD